MKLLKFVVEYISPFSLLLSHKLIDIKPMDKGVKPAVARPVGIAEPKSMPTILVEVKFYGSTCLVPGLDDSKLSLE